MLLVLLSLVCLKSWIKFLWISCKAQGNAHSIVCLLLRLSVCQWGNGHRKFSWAEPHSCLSDRFKPPSLFLWLLVFSSFTVCEDIFASASMMQKHSMNPFILQISPTKSPCVHPQTAEPSHDPAVSRIYFVGEPVNFADVRLVNKRSQTCSLKTPRGMSQAGASMMTNGQALERALVFVFCTLKGQQ